MNTPDASLATNKKLTLHPSTFHTNYLPPLLVDFRSVSISHHKTCLLNIFDDVLAKDNLFFNGEDITGFDGLLNAVSMARSELKSR